MAKKASRWAKAIVALAERLARHDVFEVELPAAKAVAGADLTRAEKRLGAAIPAPLRELYEELGEGGFAWGIRKGREHELGLDRSDAVSGRLELIAVAKLKVAPAGWVRFTNDGAGGGLVFAVTKGKKVLGGVYEHSSRQVTPAKDSLDDLFAKALEHGFSEPGANEDVASRIVSGKLKPRAKKPVVPTSTAKKPPAKKRGPLIKLKNTYATAVAIGRTRAVIAERSGRLRVVDLASGMVLHDLTAGDTLLALAMVGDDVAVTGSMNALEIWSLDNGTRTVPKEPFPPRASSLAAIPGSRRVAAGGYTDLVVWDVDKARVVAQAAAPTSFVSVDARGTAYALGSTPKGEAVLRTWAVAGKEVSTPDVMPKGTWPSPCVVFGADDVALFPHEAGVAAYDTSRKKWRTAPPKGAKFRALGASLPNGDVLVTHPSDPKLLRLRSNDGTVAGEQSLPVAIARSAIAVDPDGMSALVAFGDGSVWVVPVPS